MSKSIQIGRENRTQQKESKEGVEEWKVSKGREGEREKKNNRETKKMKCFNMKRKTGGERRRETELRITKKFV